MSRLPDSPKSERAALADGPEVAPGRNKHPRIYSVSPETQVAIYTLLPIVIIVGIAALIAGGRP